MHPDFDARPIDFRVSIPYPRAAVTLSCRHAGAAPFGVKGADFDVLSNFDLEFRFSSFGSLYNHRQSDTQKLCVSSPVTSH